MAAQVNPNEKGRLGGPMLYLRQLPAGKFLALAYGIMCFFFCLIGGNSIQAKSITDSLVTSFGFTLLICAIIIGLFILYVVYGGAARIVKMTDAIMPLKVIVFFGSTLIVLAYHFKSIGRRIQPYLGKCFFNDCSDWWCDWLYNPTCD